MSGSERPDPTPRLAPTRWLKRRILEEQGGLCLACRRALSDVEFDHVVPLGLGGDNERLNLVALCPDCNKIKTRLDLKRIAKAERQRLHHETGRSRRSPSRGFPTHLRKRLDGVVVPRKDS